MVLAAIWEFLKKIPGWVWLVVAGALVGFSYVQQEKARARKDEQNKQAKRESEQREILVNTVDQLEQETEDAKDRALAAPDTVSDVSSADELRERYPDNARVILRPHETGGRNGPR